MGKLYTLDGKLLTETPEIRIGEKVYAVDNRKKTFEQMNAIMNAKSSGPDSMGAVLELALGKKAVADINADALPFPAYQKLIELVMAAITGEEPDEVADRFQSAGKPQN